MALIDPVRSFLAAGASVAIQITNRSFNCGERLDR
jgi:hypothetical protein